MNVKNVITASVLAASLGPHMSYAGQSVIAMGSISGSTGDLATNTSGPLENGAAGNRLGGVGSGLAHAGGDTFIAVPDRGPNADVYNTCVDNTASYITRFQTIRLQLTPNPAYPGTGLPFVLTPTLQATTLLASSAPLVYGSGLAGCGLNPLPSGAPALNNQHTYYFTGRSDNFDLIQLSTYPKDARFDPESVRVAKNGKSVFITDEYGPYVYRFDRESGKRNAVFTLPEKFAVSSLFPVGNDEISSNTRGRVANKGMEGLAITPDGSTLVGIMQSPLIQDGGTDASTTRIVTIDIETGAVTHEYAYKFDNLEINPLKKPKYGTASEILAVNDHVFLVDERDGKGLGDGSSAVQKKIYMIDLAAATDVSGVQGEAALSAAATAKTLFLNVVAALGAAPSSLTPAQIPAKLEGMAFGEDIAIDGATKHTLYIANDNDFDTSALNPNQFFVFAFDDSDLHGQPYVPQIFVK